MTKYNVLRERRRKQLSILEMNSAMARFDDECGRIISRKATCEEIDYARKLNNREGRRLIG